MLTREQIQRTVIQYFADKPVERVYLFGSYARGEEKESSDVDLLIDFSPFNRLTLFDLGNMKHVLEEVYQLHRVDLIDRSALQTDRLFTQFAEAQKQLLYERIVA